ncbi:type II secretion system F family protein [Halalkalibacillus halophilus]|uniref:type II secretion system F family protein n=1 Tax=Halalkalibacillus halophilus TaxID=392827 RepID=UPI00040E8D0D|nr:type II secretion system F family protein [Halalkalibacillus halophilus]
MQNFKKKLTLKKQIDFLDRLGKLLDQNFSFKRALELMTHDPEFYELAERFVIHLKQGKSIESCFRDNQFHSIVVAFLFVSKQSGNFSEHIVNCTRALQMKHNLVKKLNEVLRYPMILLFFSIIIFFSISTFLIPLYHNSYSNLGNDQSVFWFQLIIYIIQYGILGLGILFAITFISLYFLLKNIDIEGRIELLNKIPIYNRFLRLTTTSHFSYHLAALLSNGRTIKDSLDIIRSQSDLPILKHYAEIILEYLSKGQPITQGFAPLVLIEGEMKILVLRSVEQGTLRKDLNAYALLVTESLEGQTKKMILFVQPLIYCLLGIIIITIYVLTLFPMFQMINNL